MRARLLLAGTVVDGLRCRAGSPLRRMELRWLSNCSLPGRRWLSLCELVHNRLRSGRPSPQAGCRLTRSCTHGRRGMTPILSTHTIGVIGSGTREHDDDARPIGELLADLGVNLLTGGGAGVMKAVSRAFVRRRSGRGICIGII